MTRILRLALAGLLAVAAVGCGGSEDGPEAVTEAACRHFGNIAGDVNDGVLEVGSIDMQRKLVEIRDTAQAADAPTAVTCAGADAVEAHKAFRDLSGTDQELADTINALGSACERVTS